MNEKEVIEKLNDLIKLDHDAVNAYEEAIKRIDINEVSMRLREFQNDHRRHIDDLSEAVRQHGGTPASKPSIKGFFLKQMTSISSSMGNQQALKAMQANETLTNKTYSEAIKKNWPASVRPIIEKNYQDEQRHLNQIKEWVDQRIWERGAAHP